ncbi:GNAT family N-acetyltransferase [Roseibium sp. FZY0029]|uniref:GNAT family N-acetyltransferase n=1 Tax=Roseibium sp. FZY0029 TaxID=3116647 RepID=UPI002EBB4168|nr:GNAT family N-acetyltransferase [Roseibium sp. FZY0029]
MSTQALNLDGYTDIPEGKVAFVVTFLEMLQAPERPLAPPRSDVTLRRWETPETDSYRKLFREVGEDWIWFGRLVHDDATLRQLLAEPGRENYLPMIDGKPVGTLELDFANPQEPELAYFGLVPGAIGGGLGRWLMAQALDIVWSRPETKRLWVHTCTGDSPQALAFYRACGFKPYGRAIEVAEDPRLLGLLGPERAPHVPVIGGR